MAIGKLEDLMHQTSKNIDRISKDIDRISKDIGDLSDGLKLEAEARKSVSKDVDTKIAKLKGALWLATALGGAIVAILLGYLAGLISFG
jgi:septation ring formation regulator EzrA